MYAYSCHTEMHIKNGNCLSLKNFIDFIILLTKQVKVIEKRICIQNF